MTVTAKGQVTFRKDLLRHLGVGPGDKIAVVKLPDGRVEIRAAREPGRISDAFKILQGNAGSSLSIEAMNEPHRKKMGRRTLDTNVLVRAVTGDDKSQSAVARTTLEEAELVALALPALCELVRVLSRSYKVSAADMGS